MEIAATGSDIRSAAKMMTLARREELRTHPSPDDLVAYHAKALTPRQSDRVQDHISFCHECSRMVMQLAPEIGAARQYSPLSQQHVSEAWNRFVQRLDAPEEPAAECTRYPQSLAGPARPSSLAVLAALFFAAVGVASFSIWIWRSLPEPQGNVEVFYLRSDKDPMRSGESLDEQELAQAVSAAENTVLVLQSSSASERYSSYSVTVESDKGGSPSTVWHIGRLKPDPNNEFNVFLPAGSVSPGQYRLRLFGQIDDRQTPLESFDIQINPPPAQ